ncbi:DUF6629 family protein [Cribrihabitans sp. XS_ASV171]
MCFSAGASFALGGVLVAGGVATLRDGAARGSPWLGFASFPVLFGIQQVSEGMLWLSIGQGAPSHATAKFFLFFAYFLWPLLVPLSAALVEPDEARRRWFFGAAALGAGLGLLLYLPVVMPPDTLSITLEQHSIRYGTSAEAHGAVQIAGARLIYALVVCLPLLLSSWREIRIFGVLILASVVLGLVVASYAFTSIWCFLAALLSGWLWYALRAVPRAQAGGRAQG